MPRRREPISATAIMAGPMRAHEIAAELERFQQRGPGTDAERRAADWLAEELRDGGREVRIEPFWCRPNWALAQTWNVALAVAGSLVSVGHARIGAVLLLVALLAVAADALFAISPGRRLTVARASQNVVALPHADPDGRPRLIVTANYDAGRTGLVYRNRVRLISASLRRATTDAAPGWAAWLCLAIIWLLVTSVLRYEGHHSAAVGIGQVVPTAALIIAGALLLELGTARYGPAANDNGSGAAVAVALVRAIDVAAPRNMTVELVLQGAGEGGAIGLRKHLRRRRRELGPANAAVVALASCGAGTLRYWTSDGSLLALHYSRRLRQLCAETAGASPHKGRGTTPALPARLAGIPAIALGCLDEQDLVPRSHRPTDVQALLHQPALDATVEFGLILLDALDASLGGQNAARATAPACRPYGDPRDPYTPAPCPPRSASLAAPVPWASGSRCDSAARASRW